MNKVYFSLIISVFIANNLLYGGTTATATITYSISPIDPITISGNPGPLNITTAVAGSAPSNAVDSSTTYAITTNNSGISITGSLASNMPAGVTLNMLLAAPTGATSAGSQPLSTTPTTLVSGISQIAQGSLQITYTLSAALNAAPVTGATNTVTLTIAP